MNRWLLSAFVVLVPLALGCEPPPKAEKPKSGGPPSAAADDTARPQLAQRAAPKPKPSPTAVVVAPPPPPKPAPVKRLQFKEVALPSGKKLSTDVLFLGSRQLMAMFPTAGYTYFVNGDSKDRLWGVFGYKSGKLEGSGISYYPEAKRPLYVAQFRSGVREGVFRGWNKDGKLEYWAEYRNGQPDGLVCLIKNNEPVYVQEWRFGAVKAQYLIELIDNKEFKAREIKPSDGAIDKTVQDLTAQLKLAEERYLNDEKAHRRDFVAYLAKVRDWAEYDRRTRGVPPNTPAKREELAKRDAFRSHERKLYDLWQRNFWATPL